MFIPFWFAVPLDPSPCVVLFPDGRPLMLPPIAALGTCVHSMRVCIFFLCARYIGTAIKKETEEKKKRSGIFSFSTLLCSVKKKGAVLLDEANLFSKGVAEKGTQEN